MPHETQTQPKPHDNPLNTGAIALDEFNKTIRKKTSESVEAGIANNIPPGEILSSLLQTFSQQKGPAPLNEEQVLEAIQSLASEQLPTGKKSGLIPSLLRTGRFGRAERTAPRGEAAATQIFKAQQEAGKQQRGIPKEQADLIRILQQIVGATPGGIEQREVSKAKGQALAQETKEAAKTARNFKIAEDKLKLTFKKFDEAVKETSKITGGQVQGSGRIGGTVTAFLGAIGKNSKVAPFRGQLIETATAIAKIAAPSAKVGPELIKVFSETLPDIGFFATSTSAEALEQTVTSITNAFINFRATNPDLVGDADMTVFEEQIRGMLQGLQDRGEDVFKGKATGLSGGGTQGGKVERARALRKQFPDMSKEDIIRRVNSGKTN